MTNPLSKVLFKVSNLSRSVGKNLSKKDRAWNDLLKKWNREDKEKKFRTNYPALNKEAVVFDLGGYEGQWASDIFSQYLCEIHVFEPHPIFFKNIAQRFENNSKIKVYEFGLGSKDEQVKFSTSADATSMYLESKDYVEVALKNAKTFFEKENIKQIDLMKINIEGGEYDLLEYLIETNWISRINNLQIQFHHFIPDAKNRMNNIQRALEKTQARPPEPAVWVQIYPYQISLSK